MKSRASRWNVRTAAGPSRITHPSACIAVKSTTSERCFRSFPNTFAAWGHAVSNPRLIREKNGDAVPLGSSVAPRPRDVGGSRRNAACVGIAFSVPSVVLVAVLMISSGCGRNTPPAAERNAPVTIEITGSDYKWHVLNPGKDGTLETQDDILSIQQLHVPVNTPIHLVLHSEDYLYTFSIPEHDLKEIAVPDLTFTLDFELESTGIYELRCGQLCGIIRPMMLGNLFAMSEEEYRNWIDGGPEG